eukprot:3748216-Pleurochrysis_carterae.AAC.1
MLTRGALALRSSGSWIDSLAMAAAAQGAPLPEPPHRGASARVPAPAPSPPTVVIDILSSALARPGR